MDLIFSSIEGESNRIMARWRVTSVAKYARCSEPEEVSITDSHEFEEDIPVGESFLALVFEMANDGGKFACHSFNLNCIGFALCKVAVMACSLSLLNISVA